QPVADVPARGTELPRAAVTAPAATGERTGLLAAAGAAFDAGRLIAPPGNNALELYRRVLAAHPDDPQAEAGLDRIADQLLTSAETAMLEERIDDAARAI